MGLKKKLRNREVTIGSWLTIGNQSVAEVMLQHGFEWLTVDIEHTPISFETLHNLSAVIQGQGTEILVRVGSNDELIIKRCLDIGVDGVIVPMIKTKSEAERVLNYVNYPPRGRRGVGLFRAQKYGFGFEEYRDIKSRDLAVVIQIEHIEAVNNIDSILEVEGIDAVIIGPYDLSGSMGYPGEYNRIEVVEALDKVIKACKQKEISLGYHVIEPEAEKLNAKISEGYNFLAFSTDFLFLGHSINNQMTKINDIQ